MKIANALVAAIVMLLSVGLLAQEHKPKDPERLLKARQIYLKGTAKIEEERNQKLKDFTARYIQELERIQVAYTKKGNLDAALAVRKEIEGLKPLMERGADPVIVKPEEKPEDKPRLRGVEEKLGYKLQAAPKGAKKYRGHSYQFFPERVSWEKAKARCRKMGGYIVCIKDMKELEFIWKLTGKQNTWVGGFDTVQEGQWQWLDGTKFDSKAFGHILVLDNKNGTQHWLSLLNIRGAMQLNDHWLNSDSKLPVGGYVCEWEK